MPWFIDIILSYLPYIFNYYFNKPMYVCIKDVLLLLCVLGNPIQTLIRSSL
jgi:hypothetical protein